MADKQTDLHSWGNTIGVLGVLGYTLFVGAGEVGEATQKIADHDRRIEKIEERPITDTSEIEKTISVLLTRVEQITGHGDAVQAVREDVAILKVEVENLVEDINGIPNEFPSLKQKVDQLAEAISKVEASNEVK